jgi:cobalt/nickel transport system permease protein
MHIPDGTLSAAVCVGGYVTAAATTAYSIHKINQKEDPRAGMVKASLLSAVFIVASWIHIPLPPTSVHLVLNGLMGVTLGYYAFPAILIGLFFQAVMFQHGGLTTLGVNATMLGVPALLAYNVFRLRKLRASRLWTGVLAFLGGAGGLGLAALTALVLLITSIPAQLDVEAERASIYALTLAHVPLMVLEGAFTVMIVLFLQRVLPSALEA